MSTLLKVIGFLAILGGAVVGVITGLQEDPFHWMAAVYWWVGGLIAGIIFIALGKLVARKREAAEPDVTPESSTTNTGIGNSKMSLDSKELQGYKMKSLD